MKIIVSRISLVFLMFLSIDVNALPINHTSKDVKTVDGQAIVPKGLNVRNEVEYILYNSAQKKILAGEFEEAKKDYLKSLDENPAFFPSFIGLAEIEDKNGNQSKAEDYFQQAFFAVKNSALLYTAYGRFLFKYKNITGAKQAFEKALSINPRLPSANVELAVIHLSYLNKPRSSLKYYKAAVNAAPDNIGYLYGLSSAHAASNNIEAAISVLEEVAAKLPNNALPWQYIGVHYARAGYLNKSINALNKSIVMDSTQAKTRWLLAEAFTMTKEFNSALKEYQWLVDNNVKKDVAYLKQGVVFQLMEKFGESKAAYLNAIEVNSNLADAYNNLAYLTLETKKGYKKGLEWSKKSIDLQPKNPVFLDTLGWLYYQQSSYIDAQKYLQEAVAHKPKFSEVYFHLAKVYEKLDRISDAEKYFAKAKRMK